MFKVIHIALLAAAAVALGSALGAAGSTAIAPTGGLDWSANATAFRGQTGHQFQYVCTMGGVAGSVWGTSLYTDDSSVCTAAVHSGLISFAGGGLVTIAIAPAGTSYTGSVGNGVTSRDYGPWHGSFKLVSAKRISYAGAGWSADARALRGQNGKRFSYFCPVGGTPATVWGTGVYTDDSSVCTAAVHAGLVSFAHGGSVKIRIRPGLSAYKASTRHGVTTRSYGSWSGSYAFVTG
ncbi:MAG TPA: LCCL domain-containing protein [Gaiellaceae bacterium]|nr:LCCL domain-containing protein [Gaiellaceae bacterium]